jgi:hypothetical protein
MLASHTEEVKKRAWNSITEAVWQYADSHGRVNLENQVICIVGKNRKGIGILFAPIGIPNERQTLKIRRSSCYL